jgi:hypothetical protein
MFFSGCEIIEKSHEKNIFIYRLFLGVFHFSTLAEYFYVLWVFFLFHPFGGGTKGFPLGH